jgi:hypothetical protein
MWVRRGVADEVRQPVSDEEIILAVHNILLTFVNSINLYVRYVLVRNEKE